MNTELTKGDKIYCYNIIKNHLYFKKGEWYEIHSIGKDSTWLKLKDNKYIPSIGISEDHFHQFFQTEKEYNRIHNLNQLLNE